MTALRRLAWATLAIAFAHLVFGAVVRITGSGMGCGDHWPTCYGHLFPPLDQPPLVIEWTHRLLAAVLTVAVVALALLAFARRGQPGVGGKGGVARSAAFALGVVIVTAFFGAVTVWLGNAWYATVVHLLLAATLLAALAATLVRAGTLGGSGIREQQGSTRAWRGSVAAAGLALVVVLMGGFTATFPGASAACQGFPLCSGSLLPALPTQHIQMTHRILAFLLFFHIMGLLIGFTRRREAPLVLRAVRWAFALVCAQLVIAAAMVELHLPAALRSLHQATGITIWFTVFTMAYLARRARGEGTAAVPARMPAPPRAPLAGVAAGEES